MKQILKAFVLSLILIFTIVKLFDIGHYSPYLLMIIGSSTMFISMAIVCLRFGK